MLDVDSNRLGTTEEQKKIFFLLKAKSIREEIELLFFTRVKSIK